MVAENLVESLHDEDVIRHPPLEKLAGHYEHLPQLVQSSEKNPAKLEENLHHVYGWQDSHVLKEFTEAKNSLDRDIKRFLWTVLNLFRSTSFPEITEKYVPLMLLFGLKAVCDEIVKER